MQFYHDLVTKKSFEYLQELGKKYKFILIGGWAVYLYSGNLKSKDVDIIVDYDELAKMREVSEVRKNERLKKYEINEGNFDVDIYVPHYSELGVDVAEIQNNSQNKKGFIVPFSEILLLLKLYAWHNRRGSSKGHKDELDIFSLTFLPEFDWQKYLKLIKKNNFSKHNEEFIDLLKTTRLIKELDINEQKMAKLKKNIFIHVLKNNRGAVI